MNVFGQKNLRNFTEFQFLNRQCHFHLEFNDLARSKAKSEDRTKKSEIIVTKFPGVEHLLWGLKSD